MGKKVREIMTPDPVGVYFDQTIAQAAQVMRDFAVGSVLVVDGRSLAGIVTDRDLVVRGIAESASLDAPVGPLASEGLVGVAADDDAARAEQLMRENAIRRLPVIDNGQIAGIVSLGDLATREGWVIPGETGSRLPDTKGTGLPMTITISAIIAWLITGLVIGGIAHLLVPGRNRIGLLRTLLFGIAGALVGGIVTAALLGPGHIVITFIVALIVAALLIAAVTHPGFRRRYSGRRYSSRYSRHRWARR